MKDFEIGGKTIKCSSLKGSTELIEYLTEWGVTFSSLNDFCDEYLEKYGNQLYWHYPHSDDKHNGLYFVLCSDGVLCRRMAGWTAKILSILNRTM